MTCLGNLLLWSIIADIMWRAAINQFGSRKTEGVMKLGSKISKEIKRTVSFESAVVKNSMPLMLVGISHWKWPLLDMSVT